MATEQCIKNYNKKKFEDIYEPIKEKSGHILLELLPECKCKYKCGYCGNINVCKINDMLTSSRSRYCRSCAPKLNNRNTKLSYDEVKLRVENQGMKLVSTVYINSTTKLDIICICGNPHSATIKDINRGRKCKKCKLKKSEKTCLEKYGSKNPFESEIIKEKIKSVNMEIYGVEYPQQKKSIRMKTISTNREKYGHDYAFNQHKVYEKIRKTHKEKYGYEYPLQNSEIFKLAITNSYGYKDYTMPSGKVVKIMGFENQAIDRLLTTNFPIIKRPLKESEILLEDDIPNFRYIDPKGKVRLYIPDILVKTLCEKKLVHYRGKVCLYL